MHIGRSCLSVIVNTTWSNLPFPSWKTAHIPSMCFLNDRTVWLQPISNSTFEHSIDDLLALHMSNESHVPYKELYILQSYNYLVPVRTAPKQEDWSIAWSKLSPSKAERLDFTLLLVIFDSLQHSSVIVAKPRPTSNRTRTIRSRSELSNV